MGESGHQYGQNFYTKIRTFLAKHPKQLILGSMELGQYHEVEVCQDFEAETFSIICFNFVINIILDQPVLLYKVQYLIRKKCCNLKASCIV